MWRIDHGRGDAVSAAISDVAGYNELIEDEQEL